MENFILFQSAFLNAFPFASEPKKPEQDLKVPKSAATPDTSGKALEQGRSWESSCLFLKKFNYIFNLLFHCPWAFCCSISSEVPCSMQPKLQKPLLYPLPVTAVLSCTGNIPLPSSPPFLSAAAWSRVPLSPKRAIHTGFSAELLCFSSELAFSIIPLKLTEI